MKKSLLLCAIALTLSTGVGWASNAAKTEKTLVIDDHPVTVQSFNDVQVVLVGVSEADLFIESVELKYSETSFGYNTPVFLVTKPLAVEVFRKGELIPYKQKGVLKAKFHPVHLFNPNKLC